MQSEKALLAARHWVTLHAIAGSQLWRKTTIFKNKEAKNTKTRHFVGTPLMLWEFFFSFREINLPPFPERLACSGYGVMV